MKPIQRPWVFVLWSKRTVDSGRNESRTVVDVTSSTWRVEAWKPARSEGRSAWCVRRTFSIPAALLLTIFVAAGCSSDGDDASALRATVPVSSSSSTTTAPAANAAPADDEPETIDSEEASTTSTTEASAEPEVPVEEVIADRIRGYFATRAAANAAPAPNPDDPTLAEFAVGDELAAVIANTQIRLDAGQAIRPGDQGLAAIRVGFIESGASAATAAACAIDDGVIFDVATGAVVNDVVVTHNYQVNLEPSRGCVEGQPHRPGPAVGGGGRVRLIARGLPLLIAMTILTAAPAAAADQGDVGIVDGTVRLRAVATIPGESWGSDSDCTYAVVVEDDFAFWGVRGRWHSDVFRHRPLAGEVVRG